MSARLMASAVFGAAVLAVVGFAQPPGVDSKPKSKEVAPKAVVDPLDAQIGAALTNDADVKLAHAKLQLADAELARARQQVTQKVTALDSAIREQTRLTRTAQDMFAIVNEAYKAKQGSLTDMLQAREKLETSQAKLAQLETEMKLVTGKAGGPKAAADGWQDLNAVHREKGWGNSCLACHTTPIGVRDSDQALAWFQDRVRREPVKGPVADRIRTALDKVVKIGPKDAKATFEEGLEIFKKEAGLDVPVRAEFKVGAIVSLGEELPVGAWLQLYADGTKDVRILVREYGLLVTNKDSAPPDAMSVFEFWKQKPKAAPEK